MYPLQKNIEPISGIICVPFSMLNAMFHKAGLLISHGQQARAAPGANANLQRLVKNESAPTLPCIVTSKSLKHRALYYECSANCISFAA